MNVWRTLLIGILLLIPVHAYSETKTVSLKVKAAWVIKIPPSTTEDAKIDKGSVFIPVKTTPECSSRYKINKLFFSIDTTDTDEVLKELLSGRSSLVNLEMVILKLFQGRGHAPELKIITKKGETYKLAFNNVIDVNAWPKKGYKIVANYQADKMVFPEHWKEIEMICD